MFILTEEKKDSFTENELDEVFYNAFSLRNWETSSMKN